MLSVDIGFQGIKIIVQQIHFALQLSETKIIWTRFCLQARVVLKPYIGLLWKEFLLADFWKNSSNATSAAAYLHLQQEQRRSKRILRAEHLSYEWKLTSVAKMLPKKFRSC